MVYVCVYVWCVWCGGLCMSDVCGGYVCDVCVVCGVCVCMCVMIVWMCVMCVGCVVFVCGCV